MAANERLALILSAINDRLRAQLAALLLQGPRSDAERRLVVELQESYPHPSPLLRPSPLFSPEPRPSSTPRPSFLP